MQNFKNYEEATNSLFKLKVDTIDLSLDRIKLFLNHIGNPENELKCIHIAGTNGKGSVLKYIETVLIEAGYRVGSYTSPHLIEFTERIAINNQPISKEDFTSYANFVYQKQNELKDTNLTVFEILAAMAFQYFKNQKVDIVLLETGLGGRLDATNVIKNPLVSVITNIDIDHIDYLGGTIEKIGSEKAGIIKENRPVIIDQNNRALKVIQEVAKNKKAEIILIDFKQLKSEIITNTIKQKIINTNDEELFTVSMPGKHQLENISIALKVLETLKLQGYKITDDSIKSGFEKTFWPGRAQYIEKRDILLDGAHNHSGAIALKDVINSYFKEKKVIWIIGILKTKDYKSILKTLINENDTIILTKPVSKNAVQPEELEKEVQNIFNKPETYTFNDLEEALNKAEDLKSKDSMIVITGSLYLIGNYLTLNQ